MKTIRYQGATESSRTLIVLLPGLYDHSRDFARERFIALARASPVGADLVAVNANFSYYRARTIVPRLHQDVIAPARRAGYREIWLVGISLGGLGALLYLKAHPADVAGVVLLSPYLGNDELTAEIAAAGSLAAWRPGSACGSEPMCALWWWLRAYTREPPGSRATMLLGYGNQDRFPVAHRLLAQSLGAQRSVMVDGGHDWGTWQQLWQQFLDGQWGGALRAEAPLEEQAKK